MTETDACQICGVTRENHRGLRHMFVAPGETRNTGLRPNASGSDASSHDAAGSQGSLGIASRGDPVLRFALIRAGVLTAKDLELVEAELKASGFVVASPPPRLG